MSTAPLSFVVGSSSTPSMNSKPNSASLQYALRRGSNAPPTTTISEELRSIAHSLARIAKRNDVPKLKMSGAASEGENPSSTSRAFSASYAVVGEERLGAVGSRGERDILLNHLGLGLDLHVPLSGTSAHHSASIGHQNSFTMRPETSSHRGGNDRHAAAAQIEGSGSPLLSEMLVPATTRLEALSAALELLADKCRSMENELTTMADRGMSGGGTSTLRPAAKGGTATTSPATTSTVPSTYLTTNTAGVGGTHTQGDAGAGVSGVVQFKSATAKSAFAPSPPPTCTTTLKGTPRPFSGAGHAPYVSPRGVPVAGRFELTIPSSVKALEVKRAAPPASLVSEVRTMQQRIDDTAILSGKKQSSHTGCTTPTTSAHGGSHNPHFRELQKLMCSTLYNIVESVVTLCQADSGKVMTRQLPTILGDTAAQQQTTASSSLAIGGVSPRVGGRLPLRGLSSTAAEMVAICNIGEKLRFPPSLIRHQSEGSAEASVLATGIALNLRTIGDHSQARSSVGPRTNRGPTVANLKTTPSLTTPFESILRDAGVGDPSLSTTPVSKSAGEKDTKSKKATSTTGSQYSTGTPGSKTQISSARERSSPASFQQAFPSPPTSSGPSSGGVRRKDTNMLIFPIRAPTLLDSTITHPEHLPNPMMGASNSHSSSPLGSSSSTTNIIGVLVIENKHGGSVPFSAVDESLCNMASRIIGEIMTRMPSYAVDWSVNFFDPIALHVVKPFVPFSRSPICHGVRQQSDGGEEDDFFLTSLENADGSVDAVADTMRRLKDHVPEQLIHRAVINGSAHTNTANSATALLPSVPAATAAAASTAASAVAGLGQAPTLKEIDSYLLNLHGSWQQSVRTVMDQQAAEQGRSREMKAVREELRLAKRHIAAIEEELRLSKLDAGSYKAEYSDLHNELQVYLKKKMRSEDD